MLSLKLIDYNRFQRLHLENLLMDFKRLGLNQPDFKINPQDKVGDGFLKVGKDIFEKYEKSECRYSDSIDLLNLAHLERVIVHFLPDDELPLRGMLIAYRYKAFIGEDRQFLFQRFSGISFEDGSINHDLKMIRTELDFMLFSITRSYINVPLKDTARQNIWVYAFCMGLLQYCFFFVVIVIYDLFATIDIPISSLLVPFLGTVGACFAIKQKVDAMPEGPDQYRNVLILNASLMSILFGLFRGAASAVILNMILVSQFIQGEIFPEYHSQEGNLKPGLADAFGYLIQLNKYPASEIAKILIWSLVAGYSERLIPNTIKKLSDSQENAMQTISQPITNISPNSIQKTQAIVKEVKSKDDQSE